MTCALHGISKADFERHYLPACRLLTRDNAIGQFVFRVSHLLQRLRFARRGVLRMVLEEQANPGLPPRMSGVLWDVFSGSASYTDVLLRTIRPVFVARLLWNLLAANIHPGPRSAAKVSAT
jgi:hypothetical protein